MRRLLLFGFSILGAALAVTASPALPGVIEVIASPSALFLPLALLAVTAAAFVVVALGLVSNWLSQVVDRAVLLDFPAPQTGTPELTSAA